MDFSMLKGMTLTKVYKMTDEDGVIFETADKKFLLSHDQECCEQVYLKDISGDLNDLIETEILLAEERTKEVAGNKECCGWTFYTIRTIKGTVDISFYGESNGHYTINASFMPFTTNVERT